jgi:hypothetical protein
MLEMPQPAPIASLIYSSFLSQGVANNHVFLESALCKNKHFSGFKQKKSQGLTWLRWHDHPWHFQPLHHP